jgi:hypothetical protein
MQLIIVLRTWPRAALTHRNTGNGVYGDVTCHRPLGSTAVLVGVARVGRSVALFSNSPTRGLKGRNINTNHLASIVGRVCFSFLSSTPLCRYSFSLPLNSIQSTVIRFHILKMLFRSLVPAALAALSLTSVAHAQFVAIQGVQDGLGPGGARPARLEISKLQQDPYAWYVHKFFAMSTVPSLGFDDHPRHSSRG